MAADIVATAPQIPYVLHTQECATTKPTSNHEKVALPSPPTEFIAYMKCTLPAVVEGEYQMSAWLCEFDVGHISWNQRAGLYLV